MVKVAQKPKNAVQLVLRPIFQSVAWRTLTTKHCGGPVERGPAARSTRAALLGDRVAMGTVRGGLRQLEAYRTLTSRMRASVFLMELGKTECALILRTQSMTIEMCEGMCSANSERQACPCLRRQF